ncbi:MAG: hypothetical protein WC501_05205 [Candidatus Micrarchaeia archaeon]
MKLGRKIIIPIIATVVLCASSDSSITRSFSIPPDRSVKTETIVKSSKYLFENSIKELNSISFEDWNDFCIKGGDFSRKIENTLLLISNEKEKQIAYDSIMNAVKKAQNIKDLPIRGFLDFFVYGVTHLQNDSNVSVIGILTFLSLSDNARGDFLFESYIMDDFLGGKIKTEYEACLNETFAKHSNLKIRSLYFNLIDSWNNRAAKQKIFDDITQIVTG